MGSLVKELPIGEMMATMETLSRFGICRQDLILFRKMSTDEQRRRVVGFLGTDTLPLTRPGIVFDVPAVNDFDTKTAFTALVRGTTPFCLPDSFKRNMLSLTGYSQNKGKVRLMDVTVERWNHFDLIKEIGDEDSVAVPLYHVYKAFEYKTLVSDFASVAAFVRGKSGALAFLFGRKIPDGWAISLMEPTLREGCWTGGMQLVSRA